jgi:membrane fusion protein (multidrug efflux system)
VKASPWQAPAAAQGGSATAAASGVQTAGNAQ